MNPSAFDLKDLEDALLKTVNNKFSLIEDDLSYLFALCEAFFEDKEKSVKTSREVLIEGKLKEELHEVISSFLVDIAEMPEELYDVLLKELSSKLFAKLNGNVTSNVTTELSK
eukprot:Pgem_evm1s6713